MHRRSNWSHPRRVMASFAMWGSVASILRPVLSWIPRASCHAVRIVASALRAGRRQFSHGRTTRPIKHDVHHVRWNFHPHNSIGASQPVLGEYSFPFLTFIHVKPCLPRPCYRPWPRRRIRCGIIFISGTRDEIQHSTGRDHTDSMACLNCTGT